MLRPGRGVSLRITGEIAATVLLAGCTLGQVPPREQACTLIGCGASLEVRLVGDHVPTEFHLTLRSSTEDIVNVHCTDGNAEFDPPEAVRWSPACPAGGVSFLDFTPAALTATVRWSEGEVTQELQPLYTEHQPNGPHCEPTCRTATVEVRIPRIPPYGDSSTWKTYIDEPHGFRIKYPQAFGFEAEVLTDGTQVAFLGDQIQIRTGPDDPLACRGDCPLIESTEAVSLAGRPAHQLRGYIGSVGGNVPQYFMMYLFRLGDGYASFVLYAESRHFTSDDPSVIRPLKEEDIELFGRIMQTLEFLP